MCSSIVSLIIYGLVRKGFEDEYAAAFWQSIMVLALQLIIYQKELIALFKPKNR